MNNSLFIYVSNLNQHQIFRNNILNQQTIIKPLNAVIKHFVNINVKKIKVWQKF